MTQEKFIADIQLPHMSSTRLTEKEDPLTSEHADFRSLTGDMHRISGNSRPDAAAPPCLLQSGQPVVGDLVALVRVAQRIKECPDIGIVITPIPVKDMAWCSLGDSTFANAAQLKIQGGL